jgi:hypothetical protein
VGWKEIVPGGLRRVDSLIFGFKAWRNPAAPDGQIHWSC